MFSTWVAIGVVCIYRKNTRKYSFEPDDSFPEQFSFTESFETQGSYMCGYSSL